MIEFIIKDIKSSFLNLFLVSITKKNYLLCILFDVMLQKISKLLKKKNK